ncbi:hypothetical protein [Cellulomonas uda]|uniref:Uncharacterized protein n=1 Tax=Cellulomonas uda TaxID=1714 RepID=A0A4Y3KAT5_CELUD|nr:hypothetical protein [Cellulomonas uda]NII67803.1 hypothetical protein [Cellulomonas uda]GEA79950.1 hypothetical protein CUD01_03940 [Cellulomonas uda]
MSAQFWLSLALGAAGITGIFLAGSGRKVGWLIGLLIQPVWMVFAVVTGSWGLIPLAVGYGVVYGRNLRRQSSREVTP